MQHPRPAEQYLVCLESSSILVDLCMGTNKRASYSRPKHLKVESVFVSLARRALDRDSSVLLKMVFDSVDRQSLLS